MEEVQKTNVRNCLTAVGLLLIAFLIAIVTLWNIITGAKTSVMGALFPMAIVGVILFILGVILIIFGKRDLAAISFILTGASTLCFLTGEQSSEITILFGALSVLWSLILLTSKDPQKVVFFIINLAIGLTAIITSLGNTGFTLVDAVISIIAIGFSLYYALATGIKALHLPGHKLMREDQVTLFKESGPSIGYTILAVIVGTWGLVYLITLIGDLKLAYAIAVFIPGIERILGVVLVVLGILLFGVGKAKFSSMMFILVGIAEILVNTVFNSPVFLYIIGGYIIVIGILALIKGEAKILMGLLLIPYGASAFISVVVGVGNLPVLSLILNAVPCLVAIYLACATMSQKQVPLF